MSATSSDSYGSTFPPFAGFLKSRRGSQNHVNMVTPGCPYLRGGHIFYDTGLESMYVHTSLECINGVWLARLRTHVVRSEGFPFSVLRYKSAPVNRSFQVTIWVLMAPNSISEHVNFKNFLGGHAPRPPLGKCAFHTKHPEPEIVAS